MQTTCSFIFFHINDHFVLCLCCILAFSLCASKFKWEKKTKTGQMGLWSPGTTLDVVQMSFRMSFRSPVGFKNLTYCSVTGLWKLNMAHEGWKWKTKQNIMWFSQTPIYVYVWFGCRFRCRSSVVPHLNGLPSKQFKARIRCGGAANYGPRITEYIAEYYGVFNTAQLGWLFYSIPL